VVISESDVVPGDVVWVSFDPTRGREQQGHRPAVVVASADYLTVVDTLAIVVPVTSRHRGWPDHILLMGPSGLAAESWAMTEQIRTISRDRITDVVGHVTAECLGEMRMYLKDFLGF
jgi:mRNA interferase MazF